MDQFEEPDPETTRKPLANLIGWLSLCLLSASWGHSMGAEWQQVWLWMGLFGVAASVGLGSAHWTRVTKQELEFWKRMKAVAEHRIDRFVSMLTR